MESPKPSEPRPITSGCYVNINGKEIYIKPNNKYKDGVYDASTGLLYRKENKMTKEELQEKMDELTEALSKLILEYSPEEPIIANIGVETNYESFKGNSVYLTNCVYEDRAGEDNIELRHPDITRRRLDLFIPMEEFKKHGIQNLDLVAYREDSCAHKATCNDYKYWHCAGCNASHYMENDKHGK